MKKRKKKKISLKQRITPASIVGMSIGGLILAVGIYGAATTGASNAYSIAGLGVAWIGLVLGISLVR